MNKILHSYGDLLCILVIHNAVFISLTALLKYNSLTSHTLWYEIWHLLEYLQKAATAEALHHSPQINTLLISRQSLFPLTPKA